MSANFSSDSIVWVDGQVTLPKHNTFYTKQLEIIFV